MNNEYPRIESFKVKSTGNIYRINEEGLYDSDNIGLYEFSEMLRGHCSLEDGKMFIYQVAKSKDEVFTVGEETRLGVIREFVFENDSLFFTTEESYLFLDRFLEKKEPIKEEAPLNSFLVNVQKTIDWLEGLRKIRNNPNTIHIGVDVASGKDQTGIFVWDEGLGKANTQMNIDSQKRILDKLKSEIEEQIKYPRINTYIDCMSIINHCPVLDKLPWGILRDKDTVLKINDKVYFNNPSSHLYGKELTITGFKENEKGNILALTNLTNKNGLRVDKLLTQIEWDKINPPKPKEKKEELCVPIGSKFVVKTDKEKILFSLTKIFDDTVNLFWIHKGIGYNKVFPFEWINYNFKCGNWILQEEKKPLFKTEDGVNLYKGDKAYGVTNDFFIVSLSQVFERDGTLKLFSKKEAAEKWIDENKPMYSRKQVFDMLDEAHRKSFGTFTSFKENFRNLIGY